MSGGGGGDGERIAALEAQLAAALARIADLEAQRAQVERERNEYRQLVLLLREENAQLKRGLIR